MKDDYTSKLEAYALVLDKIISIERLYHEGRYENLYYIKLIEDFMPIYDDFIILYKEIKNTITFDELMSNEHLTTSYADYLYDSSKRYIDFYRDFKLNKIL